MRNEVVSQLEESGIIAVIRMEDTERLKQIIDSISRGGVKALEITMTTPGAIEIIRELSSTISSDFLIGVGTVLDSESASNAIAAGAQFVVSPVFKQAVIEEAHRYSRPVIPGCMTPTEIFTAWECGADIVKVFPATALGPKYFKDILGPLPQLRLTPTGGVNLENAADFIHAGACCLGVGSALLNKKMIRKGEWEQLSHHAAKFVEAVQNAHASMH